MKIYVIGSLGNKKIPKIANQLREAGHEVFDDWFGAGPEADRWWGEYERKHRNHTFPEALKGKFVQHALAFDKKHLEEADAAVLVLPAGKSGHLELGYILGKEKPAFILLASTKTVRYDLMYGLATGVYFSVEGILQALKKETSKLVKLSEISRRLMER